MTEARDEEKEPLPTLDIFLNRYTSEDNASYQEIMEVAKKQLHACYASLYQAEEEFEKLQKDNLEFPLAEHQAIENSQDGVETWKYKVQNSLMYYPEGVPDEEQLFKKPQQIVHKITRFPPGPLQSGSEQVPTSAGSCCQRPAQTRQGKP